MREKDVRKLVEATDASHVKFFHDTKTIPTADKESHWSPWIGAVSYPAFASVNDAIQAILNHLNLELHVEPSKPESVVARKKAK
jgi:hypothetical protein